MNNSGGALDFDAVINNTEFKKQIDEMTRKIIMFSDTTVKETKKADDSISKMTNTVKSLAGAWLSFSAAKGFVQQLISVRSEFQNTEASFKVFLGDAEKAAKFMKEIQSYAFYNVFEFKDLTESAAQLLAFQHNLEDIIPILDSISNIAAGANIPLTQLVDLYNKSKSLGKMFTQDIQQWQRAGVPMIQELAKQFNITEQAMWGLVQNGKVGFKEVDAVIKTLTSDGGMFAGMMEEKMKTLGDSIGLLQDSITAMFNELGEKNQDFLRGGILAVNELVENYEKVGKILLSLVATYGAYKVAVMAVNAAEMLRYQSTLAHMAGMTKMQAVMDVLRAKTAALSKTMLANPYVLVATALVGLVTAMWALRDTTTAEEKAQNTLNEQLQKTKEWRDSLIGQSNEYVRIINDETETLYRQIQKYKELQELFPELFKNVSFEEFKNLETVEVTAKIKTEVDKQEIKSINELYEEQLKIVEELRREIEITKSVSPYAVSAYGQKLKEALALAEEYKKQLEEAQKIQEEAEGANQPLEIRLEKLNEQYSSLEKQREELAGQLSFYEKIEAATGFGYENIYKTEKELRNVEKALDGVSKKITVLTPDDAAIKKNKQHWQEQKENAVAAIEAIDARQLKLLQAGKYNEVDTAIADSYKQASAQIAEADRNLELYAQTSKKMTPPAPFGSIAYWEEVTKKAEEAIKTLSPGKTNYQAELDKYTQQIEEAQEKINSLSARSFNEEIEYKRRQYEIYYRYIENLGKEFADGQFKDLISESETYLDFLTKEQKKLEEKIKSGKAKPVDVQNYDTVTIQIADATGAQSALEKFKTELQDLQTEGNDLGLVLEKLYEKKKKFSTGEINLFGDQKIEAEKIIDKDIADTEKKVYNEILANYESYQKQKERVTAIYDAKIKFAQGNGLTEYVDRIKKEKNKVLGELSGMGIESSDLWKDLFKNIEFASSESIEAAIAQLDKLVDEIEDNDIKEAFVKLLDDTKREVAQRNPFSSMANAAAELEKRLAEGGDFNLVMNAFTEDMLENADRITAGFSQISDMLNKIAEATGSDEMSSMANGLNNIVSTIQDAQEGAQAYGGWWGAIIGGAVGMIGRISDAIKESKNQIDPFFMMMDLKLKQLQYAFNQLKFEIDMSVGDEYYTNQNALIENLKKQQEINQQKIEAELSKKDKNRDYDAIDAWREETEELQREIVRVEHEIMETMLQTDFKKFSDDLADALTSAFEAGEDSAEALDKTFDKLILNMIKNALKMRMIEPIVDKMLDSLMGHLDKGGTYVDFQWEKWKNLLGNISEQYSNALKEANEQLGIFNNDIMNDSSLTGAIKGVTEETASIIAGQMNAIRINQAQSLELVRQQLLYLFEIASNTRYNRYLENINNTMESVNRKLDDGLRYTGV